MGTVISLLTLIGSAAAGDITQRPPPSLLFTPLVGEVVQLGSAEQVEPRLRALGVQPAELGLGTGLLVKGSTIEGLSAKRKVNALFWTNRLIRNGELECVVWLDNTFGMHRASLFGDCHPGSGDAYVRRGRHTRVAGVAAIVGGAALFGVGMATMNSVEPPVC